MTDTSDVTSIQVMITEFGISIQSLISVSLNNPECLGFDPIHAYLRYCWFCEPAVTTSSLDAISSISAS